MPTSEQRTPTGFTEPVNAQVGTERREFQAFAPAPLPPKGIDISPSAFSEFDDNSFALADLARPRTRRDQPRESVGDHQWWCGGCGAFNERDHNAAMNLSNWQGLSFPVSGRGDCVSPAMPAVVVEASTATPVQSPIERLEQIGHISIGLE